MKAPSVLLSDGAELTVAASMKLRFGPIAFSSASLRGLLLRGPSVYLQALHIGVESDCSAWYSAQATRRVRCALRFLSERSDSARAVARPYPYFS